LARIAYTLGMSAALPPLRDRDGRRVTEPAMELRDASTLPADPGVRAHQTSRRGGRKGTLAEDRQGHVAETPLQAACVSCGLRDDLTVRTLLTDSRVRNRAAVWRTRRTRKEPVSSRRRSLPLASSDGAEPLGAGTTSSASRRAI
jgi:hypothetical protein